MLTACPTVRVAVALNGVVINLCNICVGRSIPVCGLAKVKDDGRGTGRIGVTLYTATFRSSQLHVNAVTVKMYLVVPGLALLTLVAEHGVDAQWRIGLFQRVGDWHEADVIEVTCSGAAEVGVAESGNSAVGVEIAGNPVPSGLSVIWAQLYHSKGGLCSWVDISLVVGSYKRVYKRCVVNALRCRASKQHRDRYRGK